MTEELKKDMIKEFLPEYLEEEKGKRTGFWKALTTVNSKVWNGVDWLFNKNALMKKSSVGFDPAGGILLGAFALFAAGTGVGLLGLGVLIADGMLSLYKNGADREAATARVSADIDAGLLSDRYKDVLDSRIKGLGENIQDLNGKIELYTTQKTQLPAKGAATEAFKAATTEAPAAQAPAPAPAAPAPDAPRLG